MTILDDLIKENEFPIAFIGSGISKRFLHNFPNWHNLLAEFWGETGLTNFYGYYNNLKDKLKTENPKYDERELAHYANVRIGKVLETEFNQAFNSESIKINRFSPKDAYETKMSPFKVAIARRFGNYKFKEHMKNEYNSFKKMLVKTQIILTTNYDDFIENSYNEESEYNIKKYIGQNGFFGETIGYAELYKLHGCIKSPNDIIITERDYEYFEENSVLISAKIISMMMHSPIIFLGYSLTDVNVRKIIKDVTRSLSSEEMNILERKLILVEWEEGQQRLVEEVVNDKDLGCKLRVIKTDNFKAVFEKIKSINQGIAPTEVRKYQHVIKKLIIDSGKKGTLNSVLISPEEIEKLEANMQDRNIAVAVGDQKYIFQMPNIIQYSLDYISDKDEVSTEVRLKFAANQGGNDRFPVHKILDEKVISKSSLHPTEKEKLIRRADKYSDFSFHYSKINKSSIFSPI
ncbi:SIR2 family protein [Lentibacillus sp. Marseille-P4043]|uniref:SIR2 family protein n=1 Tax=Lentibacillus sp. Marseille-P4043 TaxID=2040293 RepID=UPI001F2C132A|nr:SIR2 family protein [Lentibacillus sp. Marseille-P4043]